MNKNILLGHSKASQFNTLSLANKDSCYSNTAVALMRSYMEWNENLFLPDISLMFHLT